MADVKSTNIDPKAMLMGWSTGRQIAGQRKKQDRELVGYSYNGVVLPDINTVWDKEKYPCAFMTHNDTSGLFIVYFTPNILGLDPNGGADFYSDGASVKFESEGFCAYNTKLEITEWYLRGNYSLDSMLMGTPNIIWTNTDIYNLGDGSLVCAASDPVPVYE